MSSNFSNVSFAAIDSAVSEIDAATASQRHEVERKTSRTMENVEAEFPGIGMYLQNMRRHALIVSGLMTEEGLPTEGLSELDRWNRFNGMFVAVRNADGTVQKRENGKPVMSFKPGVRPTIFGIFRTAMNKQVVKNADGSTRAVYSGTFTLPGFNDAGSTYEGRAFTRTELGAVISQYCREWDLHPIVADIAAFGRKLEESRRQREAENINRNASRHATLADPNQLGGNRDLSNHRRHSVQVSTNLGSKMNGVLDKLMAATEPTVVAVAVAPSPEALAEVDAMNVVPTKKVRRQRRKTVDSSAE